MEKTEVVYEVGTTEEPLDKEAIKNVLTFHQYLCQHMLRSLKASWFSQQSKDKLVEHTLRHLERMGNTFMRYIESG